MPGKCFWLYNIHAHQSNTLFNNIKNNNSCDHCMLKWPETLVHAQFFKNLNKIAIGAIECFRSKHLQAYIKQDKWWCPLFSFARLSFYKKDEVQYQQRKCDWNKESNYISNISCAIEYLTQSQLRFCSSFFKLDRYNINRKEDKIHFRFISFRVCTVFINTIRLTLKLRNSSVIIYDFSSYFL